MVKKAICEYPPLTDEEMTFILVIYSELTTRLRNCYVFEQTRTRVPSATTSNIVARRAKELHIEHFYQGIHNKREVLEGLLEKLDLGMENVASIGDDLNDLQMLKASKISFVPRDASASVAYALNLFPLISGISTTAKIATIIATIINSIMVKPFLFLSAFNILFSFLSICLVIFFLYS